MSAAPPTALALALAEVAARAEAEAANAVVLSPEEARTLARLAGDGPIPTGSAWLAAACGPDWVWRSRRVRRGAWRDPGLVRGVLASLDSLARMTRSEAPAEASDLIVALARALAVQSEQVETLIERELARERDARARGRAAAAQVADGRMRHLGLEALERRIIELRDADRRALHLAQAAGQADIARLLAARIDALDAALGGVPPRPVSSAAGEGPR